MQLEDAEQKMVVVVSLQLEEAQIKLDSITNQAEQLGGFNQQELVVFVHFVEVPTELVAIAEHLAEAQQLELPFNLQLLYHEPLCLQPTSFLVQP